MYVDCVDRKEDGMLRTMNTDKVVGVIVL